MSLRDRSIARASEFSDNLKARKESKKKKNNDLQLKLNQMSSDKNAIIEINEPIRQTTDSYKFPIEKSSDICSCQSARSAIISDYESDICCSFVCLSVEWPEAFYYYTNFPVMSGIFNFNCSLQPTMSVALLHLAFKCCVRKEEKQNLKFSC